MQYGGVLDFLPLGVVFLATIALSLLSIAGGHWLGKHRRSVVDPEKVEPVSAMVGATLGLLAFVLAFTFGLAANRYDDRRQVVLDESNAIGTAYLRAQLLSEPHRLASQQMLREYVNARLAGTDLTNLKQALSRSEDLQNRLWAQAVMIARKDPDSIVMELFVEALNDVIDIHSKRIMLSLHNRIPGSIWLALYVLSIFGMVLIGYYEGLVSNRRSPAIIALVMTFSTVMLLISDLDRSREGWLQISQQSMLDLKQSIESPDTSVE